jgi:DNA-directed RNA polymerase specialized sigma24 family protein
LVGVEAENGRVCGGHCEGIIRNLAKHYRLEEPELLREFRAGCYERLWRDISAGRNKCAHVESRFGAALKARAIDVARAMARRRKRDRDFSSLPDDPEMGVGHEDEKVLLDDAVLGEIEHQRLLAFVRELPSKQGRAAQLVWIERWQVESEDPAETTAAKLMNISGRMVRKHLSAAREKLMADASLRAILEDDGRI